MKIQIISDLHLEFGEGKTSFDRANAVILAGDTHVGTKGVECWNISPNTGFMGISTRRQKMK